MLQNDVEVHMRDICDDSDHVDQATYPWQESKLQWWDLNQDFYSNPRNYKDIEKIAIENKEQELDLRPYMIERPFTVSLYDKFPKVLSLFR